MTKIQQSVLLNNESDVVKRALLNADVHINDIHDLLKRETPKLAIPILIELMYKIKHPAIKQGVIRALSSKNSDYCTRKSLIDYYNNIDSAEWAASDTKWVIANTLETIADEDIARDLIKMATNPSNGKSRQMIVIGLSKLKDNRVFDVLISLIDDSDLTGHVIIALKRLGNSLAIPYIENKLNDKSYLVRKEAKKTLGYLKSKLSSRH